MCFLHSLFLPIKTMLSSCRISQNLIICFRLSFYKVAIEIELQIWLPKKMAAKLSISHFDTCELHWYVLFIYLASFSYHEKFYSSNLYIFYLIATFFILFGLSILNKIITSDGRFSLKKWITFYISSSKFSTWKCWWYGVGDKYLMLFMHI